LIAPGRLMEFLPKMSLLPFFRFAGANVLVVRQKPPPWEVTIWTARGLLGMNHFISWSLPTQPRGRQELL